MNVENWLFLIVVLYKVTCAHIFLQKENILKLCELNTFNIENDNILPINDKDTVVTLALPPLHGGSGTLKIMNYT